MDATAQSIEKEQPLVSVIMSVYNGDIFLQKAIDSILNQTYPHLEFIIIDDNSNKQTKDILSNINDERVKIIFNDENIGLTRNLNTAIDYCKGKYIARMDADDICLPNRIEQQVAFLETNTELAGTASWIEMIDENENIKGIWSDDRKYHSESDLYAVLTKKNVIAHPTVMLRADILKKYRYNELQKHSQDWDLWLRLFADGYRIRKLTETLLLYRVHESSVTSQQKQKSVFQKISDTYYTYLQQVTNWNDFNRRVKKMATLNKYKLLLSNIKRYFKK